MSQEKKTSYVLGVMSGTSLDGVDIVYVKFKEEDSFKIIKTQTVPYTKYWYSQLKNIALYSKGDKKLASLSVALGAYYGKLLLSFIRLNKIQSIDFIASHGHTVHHQPEIGYTLQIGSGKEIAKITKIKTVYDFRSQDLKLGGQGAPLVPVGDEILFSEYDYCLNLGGFSNVSFDDSGVRKAFDICPVNTILNFYANQIGFEYDDEGRFSRKGRLNEELLCELNELDFYKSIKPKSLGIEFLNKEIYPLLAKYKISELDVMRTFVEHIAYQISIKLKKGTVLVTGGGAYHVFLLERISVLNTDLELITPSKEIIEFKEALIFALLGKLRIENKINCLSSVTGATSNHSSGKIVSSI